MMHGSTNIKFFLAVWTVPFDVHAAANFFCVVAGILLWVLLYVPLSFTDFLCRLKECSQQFFSRISFRLMQVVVRPSFWWSQLRCPN